jgi:DNA-binding PadR family transcriptional regulator
MTDAELAILSLLSEQAMTDHDLNRQIDARGLRRWTAIGVSSMYYVLEKLEKQGLVTRVKDIGGERTFQISPAGVGVLQTSVADLLGTTRTYDRGFELGLANMNVLKNAQVLTALMNRKQDLIMQRDRIRASLTAEQGNGSFRSMSLFSHRLTMIVAEIAWLETFLDEWQAQAHPEPEIVIEPAIIPRSKQVILPQDPDSIHKQQTREITPHHRATPPAVKTSVFSSQVYPAQANDGAVPYDAAPGEDLTAE